GVDHLVREAHDPFGNGREFGLPMMAVQVNDHSPHVGSTRPNELHLLLDTLRIYECRTVGGFCAVFKNEAEEIEGVLGIPVGGAARRHHLEPVSRMCGLEPLVT